MALLLLPAVAAFSALVKYLRPGVQIEDTFVPSKEISLCVQANDAMGRRHRHSAFVSPPFCVYPIDEHIYQTMEAWCRPYGCMFFAQVSPTLTQLPHALGQLTTLRSLHVAECNALVELPKSLGQLASLQRLFLYQCPALTSLPESLGQLANLVLLCISTCHSLTKVPESLGQLSKLKMFRVDRCGALTRLPDSMGQLAMLEMLCVEFCPVTRLPASLGQLALLKILRIRSCEITEAPESLGRLTMLAELTFQWCMNLTKLPEIHMTALKILVLHSCCALTMLPYLGLLTALAVLDLSQCHSLKKLPESLGQLLALNHLNIEGCCGLTQIPFSFVNTGCSWLVGDNSSMQFPPRHVVQLEGSRGVRLFLSRHHRPLQALVLILAARRARLAHLSDELWASFVEEMLRLWVNATL